MVYVALAKLARVAAERRRRRHLLGAAAAGQDWPGHRHRPFRTGADLCTARPFN